MAFVSEDYSHPTRSSTASTGVLILTSASCYCFGDEARCESSHRPRAYPRCRTRQSGFEGSVNHDDKASSTCVSVSRGPTLTATL